MNVDTGELRRLANMSEKEIKVLLGDGFIPVPEEHEKEAMELLAGMESTRVNMKKKTPLTVWAKNVKQGRNEKCTCGSGKKYKFCCGR